MDNKETIENFKEALENCNTFQDLKAVINDPAYFADAEIAEKLFEAARDGVVAASEEHKKKKQAVADTVAETGYTMEQLWEHGLHLKNGEPGTISWDKDTKRKVDEKFNELREPFGLMVALSQIMLKANEHRAKPDSIEQIKQELEARGVPSTSDAPNFTD